MKQPEKQHICIISPASAKANNGNWQTATRWARMLRTRYHVTFLATSDALPSVRPDVLITLHARRSAQALANFHHVFPTLPCIVLLTGTDLYRDIRCDADAQRSLALATRLVVLQDAGLEELDPSLRSKASVIYQSAPSLHALPPHRNARFFTVIMIGHLRAEKDPLTFMHAAALVHDPRIRMQHIGAALDPVLGAKAQETQALHGCYRWLGNMAHGATRQHLKRSQIMVLASTMEGGANVIIEAITSGVPVIASDISGNRGMLGAGYAGFFPLGDSAALARMIERAARDTAFYDLLQNQCKARAPLFAPQHEQVALLELVDNVLLQHASSK